VPTTMQSATAELITAFRDQHGPLRQAASEIPELFDAALSAVEDTMADLRSLAEKASLVEDDKVAKADVDRIDGHYLRAEGFARAVRKNCTELLRTLQVLSMERDRILARAATRGLPREDGA
jgi:hypothetical protein